MRNLRPRDVKKLVSVKKKKKKKLNEYWSQAVAFMPKLTFVTITRTCAVLRALCTHGDAGWLGNKDKVLLS